MYRLQWEVHNILHGLLAVGDRYLSVAWTKYYLFKKNAWIRSTTNNARIEKHRRRLEMFRTPPRSLLYWHSKLRGVETAPPPATPSTPSPPRRHRRWPPG